LHDPHRVGHWQLWRQSPAGQQEPVDLPVPGMDVYTPVAGDALWPKRGARPVVAPPSRPTREPGDLVGTVDLEIEVAGGGQRIHAGVAASFYGWRQEIEAQTGYDFLGTVSDVFRPLGYSGRDYGHLSWHRTGRAVDTLFEWHDPPDGPNQLLVVRDTLGPSTYWRLYLLCREQDGSMGEPLTVAPWVFWFNLDPQREAEAYAAGGRPDKIPPGYYVDLTRLAGRHGWHRIASYEEPDFDWRWDSIGREFWHYQCTDGLTWWQAMRQLYPEEALLELYGWDVCVEQLEMAPEWLRAKGIPEVDDAGGTQDE